MIRPFFIFHLHDIAQPIFASSCGPQTSLNSALASGVMAKVSIPSWVDEFALLMKLNRVETAVQCFLENWTDQTTCLDLFTFLSVSYSGTPVNRIPIMAKQVLDLYELFQLVVARGGLVEVINKKLWREITKGLNLPSSITSAAFTLRTQYMKYLYPYECDTLGLSTPSELQAAIDGNRREARRSSYSFDYPIMMPPGNGNRPNSPANLMGSHSTSSSLAASPTPNQVNFIWEIHNRSLRIRCGV
ncbi:unnamed protein product [Echinostoma caproni]|uniref:ARID domain-containing protein n=1 Tax=Echinostoma caproni TaxID=27848 RepID=A0A3P8FUK3_9TREM|nr:unnamed protein product [Echinostoma caproni]